MTSDLVPVDSGYALPPGAEAFCDIVSGAWDYGPVGDQYLRTRSGHRVGIRHGSRNPVHCRSCRDMVR